MNERPTILQCEPLAETPRQWMSERGRLVECGPHEPGFDAALREADGLIVRTSTAVGPDLLGAAPRLQVIGRAGVGLDNIDVAACHAAGVTVVYTPDANTQAVAEYVISILGHAARPLYPLSEPVDDATWRALRSPGQAGLQLSTMTLGVLGRGRAGTAVTRVARARGMTVRDNDIREVPPCGDSTAVDARSLFASCDVITIHVDGRATNRHFVGAELLGLMQPDVLLINTSRGFVVDGAALAGFLRRHPNARAHLDVHEREPIPSGDPMWAVPNATLYPHLASRTRAALEAMSWVVRDVDAVLTGRSPRHPAPISE